MKPLKDLAVYDDADFYDQEFGPVLEVACGTGRRTERDEWSVEIEEEKRALG